MLYVIIFFSTLAESCASHSSFNYQCECDLCIVSLKWCLWMLKCKHVGGSKALALQSLEGVHVFSIRWWKPLTRMVVQQSKFGGVLCLPSLSPNMRTSGVYLQMFHRPTFSFIISVICVLGTCSDSTVLVWMTGEIADVGRGALQKVLVANWRANHVPMFG